jgi:hypothetical protein
MIEVLVDIIFIRLWFLGVVFPILGTVILFHKRRPLIFWMPFISAAIWSVARMFLLWDVLFGDTSNSAMPAEIPLRSLVIMGTGALAGVVLALAALTTWVTHKVLKKIYSRK